MGMTDTEVATLRPSDATNLAGLPVEREYLSHSSISTQLNCLRRFEFERVDRLELVSRPRPLGMGSAFQKAIEMQDPNAGAALVREGVIVGDQADEDKLRVEEATVAAAAALYLRTWPADDREQREYEYRVRLRSPYTGRPSNTFDLLGYADGVTDCGGWLELTENKFVGQVNAVTVRKLPLDRQVSLACYALWRATGKTVRKVNYRFTRKPTIRQKRGETVDEFIERLTADYADPARADFYAHGEELFRSADDLLRIEQELWDWAEQLRSARRRGFYARNTSHCSDYGGCPFIPMCTGDPDAPALYRERPPAPVQIEDPIAA
jgi:hypothetical protein